MTGSEIQRGYGSSYWFLSGAAIVPSGIGMILSRRIHTGLSLLVWLTKSRCKLENKYSRGI